jgi:hypothetical protein
VAFSTKFIRTRRVPTLRARENPATRRRGRRIDRAVVVLWTLGAALVLLGGYTLVHVWARHLDYRPGDINGSPESVIFTVACDHAANRCAGHARTFDLQAETNGPERRGRSGAVLLPR